MAPVEGNLAIPAEKEKDLEEIIFNTPNEVLIEKGLPIYGKKYRQLRIGNYGISDIITIKRDIGCLFITIYELKKDNAGISAFLQAVRYAKGVKSYMNKRKPNLLIDIDIVIIGKKIDTHSDYIYLEQFFFSLSNYSFTYGINGMEFKKEYNYCLTNEGF